MDTPDTFRVTMQAKNLTGALTCRHEYSKTYSLITDGPPGHGLSYVAFHGTPAEILAAMTILYDAAKKLVEEAKATVPATE